MTCLKDKNVKTRKTHTCFGCLRKFPAGTAMNYIVSVWEGEFSAEYWCMTCRDFIGTMSHGDLEDGFMPGEVKELIEEKHISIGIYEAML